MNWLPSNGSQNQNIRKKNYIERSLWNATSQVIKRILCLVGTGMFLSGDVAHLSLESLASVSPQKLFNQINQVASDISVKILDQDFLGSGFIVQQTGQKYIVITNQHVLRAGESPYLIQTVDGKKHLAKVISKMNDDAYNYDLAILEFETDITYPTAKIGNSFHLEVGEPVFAVGFPYNQFPGQRTPTLFEQSDLNQSPGLAIKQGRIAIILNQALEEGYQIGYTNDVKKGMSGGPLLNYQGEVVGVNGKHAYPLWESPEVYQDGSEPCPALQELITRSSLAIPIEKSIELEPQLKSLSSSFNPETIADVTEPKLHLDNPQLVARMQAEAQEIKQKCQDYLNQSTPKQDPDTDPSIINSN